MLKNVDSVSIMYKLLVNTDKCQYRLITDSCLMIFVDSLRSADRHGEMPTRTGIHADRQFNNKCRSLRIDSFTLR